MAGSKRPLSQTDGNVANPYPPSKRTSQHSAAGKENATSDYTSMKKVDLQTLLQERNLPYSGIKDVLIRRLEEYDRHHSSAASSKRATGNGHASAQPVELEFEYLMLCRPQEDIRAEKRANKSDDDASEELDDEEDEDYDEQDEGLEGTTEATSEGGQRRSICGLKKCVCKLPASEHPEHRWILTNKGYLLVARLQYEVDIRDQDAIGAHICSDFNGYGFQEVMENQLLSFNREFSNGRGSPVALWSIVEGFAWILNDPDFWFNIDNPDAVLATLKLIGGAVFNTLNTLEENGLLCSDSPVKNIALVLGVLYNNTRDWPGDEGGELDWRGAMIREASRHGIEVIGQPYGIETVLKKDGVAGTHPIKADSKWKLFDWAKEFKAFSKKHRKGSKIGGRYYVLASEKDVTRLRRTFGLMWDR